MESDFIILDIRFHNEMDGMEHARRIREPDAHVSFVFISISDAYPPEGYAVNAVRRLSKPIKYKDGQTVDAGSQRSDPPPRERRVRSFA